ncbi:MAG: P1 family peptidase [Clostridiales bacterium]|nr:P1 family peptidase [Clostridiales bacterium]
MSMKIINITDIKGFKLGNAENKEKGTGCTVIVCEEGAVGGVDVRGGGPATRETDLLRSENTVDSVHAVVLSGGSAFGLEAASGVMRELSARGLGFDVGTGIMVPIVCGASLYDLAVGDPSAFPDVNMGMCAVQNAYEGLFSHGNHGAGTGATVGKYLGHERAMKTGLGTFACGDGFIEVGAIAAVNAIGDVYSGAGHIIAGLRSEDGESIYGTIKTLKGMVHDNVNLVDDSTSFINRSDIEKALAAEEAAREEPEAEEDLIDELIAEEPPVEEIPDEEPAAEDAPSFEEPAEEPSEEYQTEEPAVIDLEETETPEQASEEMSEETSEEQGVPEESFEEPAEEEAVEEEPVELTREELGYNIAFNTTIGCLITNASLTKSQANKLASILHDAYARAIKPVHGTLDGDTIFVLTTGKQKVNFDAFAALAADVMQYAIIDGATSAKGAYGLPAASDMKKAEND